MDQMQPMGGQMPPSAVYQYLKMMQQSQPQSGGALGTNMLAAALDRFNPRQQQQQQPLGAMMPGTESMQTSIVDPNEGIMGGGPPMGGRRHGLSGLLGLGKMFL